MSRTVHPRPPRKSLRRNMLDVAFHLRNARRSIEQARCQASTEAQHLELRALERDVDDCVINTQRAMESQ